MLLILLGLGVGLVDLDLEVGQTWHVECIGLVMSSKGEPDENQDSRLRKGTESQPLP